MSAWLVLLLALAQHTPPGDPAVPSSDRESDARTERLLRWREDLELDLPSLVIADAGARFSTAAPADAPDEEVALVARAILASGDPARAAEFLRGRAASPLIEIVRARIEIERDELAAAEKRLSPAPATTDQVRFPDLPECWLLLGRARARLGRELEAEPLLAHFVRVAPLDPEASSAWFMLARAAQEDGDAQEAEHRLARAREVGEWTAFRKTRRLQARASPADPLPHVGLAQLWMAVDRHDDARAEIRSALALDEKSCRALETSAEIELRAGDRAAARAALEKALACDPGSLDARWTRARLALLEKRDADARADLEALVASPREADPKFLRAHSELARILRAAGDAAGADARLARWKQLGGH